MPQTVILGTEQSDTLLGDATPEIFIGLAGDDIIEGSGGADVIYGDYIAGNLLDGADGATSFAQYGETGAWVVNEEADGHTSMTQTVDTVAGATYEISFELATNYAANVVSGAVEVLWNGTVIDSFDTSTGVFDAHSVSFIGTGGPGSLTFRSIEAAPPEGPQVQTDLPIFYYETEKEVGGQTVTVKAIAEGQSHIYQVLNGKLHIFDTETESYTAAGADATVTVNAIGFNPEDNLIYGIAVANGTDSLGQAVSKSDLVFYDAAGDVYRVGETPYRSWTADVDGDGNLWAFQSSMDRVTMIDLDQFDENGNPVTVTYKFPRDMITDQVWDVGFDPSTETFYGIVRPSHAGANSKLFQIDISAVSSGGEPTFSTTEITGTLIDGVMRAGVPAITFGAFVVDGDGNLYAGGNSGDHDMNSSTGSSGGIYRVVFDDNGGVTLELVADAPRSYSNDGAVDPRTADPFLERDASASVLIRSPEVVETPDAATTYDDEILAGAAADSVESGFGEDLVVGAGGGDTIDGGIENDALYGGAGPDAAWNGLISIYDAEGNRVDQYGNPLPENDDILRGGEGDDFLHGSAGHDRLEGGTGNDELVGGTGFDSLFGGEGTDTMNGGSNQDSLWGGDGNDDMNGSSGDDALWGEAGDDLMVGGSGADEMHGGLGADTIKGGSGDEFIFGGDGADYIDGGVDDDVLNGDDGADYIKGGSGNDTLNGGTGNDRLTAASGDDVLDGGDGKDTLYLGAGADIATGGTGSDRFVFRTDDFDGSTDRITDFRRGSGEADRLDMRSLDLLDGTTAEDWKATYVIQQADGSVKIELGLFTLCLDSRGDDGADLYADVCAGLEF